MAVAFSLATIRDAIEQLMDGSHTGASVRTLSSGVFATGVHEGKRIGARQALTLDKTTASHRFDVRFGSLRDHEATNQTSLGNRRISRLEIFVDVFSRLATVIEDDQRTTDIDTLYANLEDVVQAMHYPDNLTQDKDSNNTGIVGGLLFGPDGSGSPEIAFIEEDWDAQMLTARIDCQATLSITQAVS